METESHLGLYYPYGYLESASESPFYGPEGLRRVAGAGASNLVGSSPDESRDAQFWPQFLQSCLPLLCETWLEARPEMKDEKRGRYNLKSKSSIL